MTTAIRFDTPEVDIAEDGHVRIRLKLFDVPNDRWPAILRSTPLLFPGAFIVTATVDEVEIDVARIIEVQGALQALVGRFDAVDEKWAADMHRLEQARRLAAAWSTNEATRPVAAEQPRREREPALESACTAMTAASS